FLLLSPLVAMRKKTVSMRTLILVAITWIALPAYLFLPAMLTGFADFVGDLFGSETGQIFRTLAMMLEGSGIVDPSIGDRYSLWAQAWNVITDSPFLGMPTDSYFAMVRTGLWVHNFFLEQWIFAGFVGVVSSIVLVGGVMRATWRLLDAADERVFLVGVV